MKNIKKTKFQFLQFSLVFSTFLFVLSILFINCDKGNNLFKPGPYKDKDVAADVLEDLKKPPQTGVFNNATEINYTGTNGTKVNIPANAFVDLNGNPVTTNIKIELIEATSKKDIFIQNTPTIINGQILISGGVLYFNATSNGNQLIALKPIEFIVPTDSIDFDMELFSSNSDSTGVDFSWNFPDSSWTIDYDTIFPYNYIIKIQSSFGWINIDKLMKYNTPKINYCIKPIQNIDFDSSSLFLIINEQNSMLIFPYNDTSFYFENIPSEIRVTLLGISSLSNKLMCGVLNDSIKNIPFIEMNFNYVSVDRFKTIVDSILY